MGHSYRGHNYVGAQGRVSTGGQLDGAGITQRKLLHVAQSLFHDHQIATTKGLATCWIDRREGTGWGATKEIPNQPKTDWRFPSLKAFADAVDAE